MRLLPAILLLAAVVHAQETAADLFYRAFWLETAQGKPDEAYELYKNVADLHKRSPEAPRALLGMARILAAKGEDFSGPFDLLRAHHPNAKREIEAVSRLAAGGGTGFDPSLRSDDAPLARKIKSLYGRILAQVEIKAADRDLLVDAGAAARPMLRELLRSLDFEPVYEAAQILLAQNHPDASEVIEQALFDDAVLFKRALVRSIAQMRRDAPGLARALVRRYETASTQLQSEIARTMARLVTIEGEAREIAYGLLARALQSKDSDVRRGAFLPNFSEFSTMSKVYVEAFLQRLEAKDPIAASDRYTWLLHLADRPEVAARAEPILAQRSLRNLSSTTGIQHEEGVMLLARVALQRTGDPYFANALMQASSQSPKAAAFLLREAMRLGLRSVPAYVSAGARRRHGRTPALARHLGVQADVLRREALAGCYGEHAEVCRAVVRPLGLGAEHFDPLLAVIRAHPGAGLPGPVLAKDFLKTLGPAQAAELAAHAKGTAQFDALLLGTSAGDVEAWVPFWKAVIPHVGPAALDGMSRAAKAHYEAALLVGMRLFEAKGEEWGWFIFGEKLRTPTLARMVWSLQQVKQAMYREPLKSALLGAVLDPRQLVAYSAVTAARHTPGPMGREALMRARQSPWVALRSQALGFLGQRGPKGVAKLVEIVDWNTLDAGSAYRHLSALAQAGDARHAGLVARFLQPRANDCAYVWEFYEMLDAKGAAERALDEALGEGEAEFRFGALEVLTRSNDPRRIAVFAKVLEGSEGEAIKLVLDTAAEQYLAELGEGVLRHLRSPDDGIREHAMEAVEKLKFYADAKRALSPD